MALAATILQMSTQYMAELIWLHLSSNSRRNSRFAAQFRWLSVGLEATCAVARVLFNRKWSKGSQMVLKCRGQCQV
jgi:hypothetical protein